VFAPYGFTDLFRMTACPNPILAPEEVYVARTDRCRAGVAAPDDAALVRVGDEFARAAG
jgi:hypothetical protein